MYLFILESIGTQELILIGIIALVVFGPRKMPELARKLGTLMNDFRRVSGEFRSTWENAVDLESIEEPKKIKSASIEPKKIGSENTIGKLNETVELVEKNGDKSPSVKELTKEEFDELVNQKAEAKEASESERPEKADWL